LAEENNEKDDPMGYTATDTVSCRLLPAEITELRELATIEGVSLSRLVGRLCLAAIQDYAKTDLEKQAPDIHRFTGDQ
jgi:hypothetical protein